MASNPPVAAPAAAAPQVVSAIQVRSKAVAETITQASLGFNPTSIIALVFPLLGQLLATFCLPPSPTPPKGSDVKALLNDPDHWDGTHFDPHTVSTVALHTRRASRRSPDHRTLNRRQAETIALAILSDARTAPDEQLTACFAEVK